MFPFSQSIETSDASELCGNMGIRRPDVFRNLVDVDDPQRKPWLMRSVISLDVIGSNRNVTGKEK
jgi:hypothetical protein